MSEATDFLREWIRKAAVRAPSVTRVTGQRWLGVGGPPDYQPGIASYGWGHNGRIIKGSDGAAIGLRFNGARVWFSDRGLNISEGPPNFGQQFRKDRQDEEALYLTLAGDAVQLRVVLRTWGTEFTVTTTMFDSASQQLIFSVPGAGPDAPQALMILSLADTGEFFWL